MEWVGQGEKDKDGNEEDPARENMESGWVWAHQGF